MKLETTYMGLTLKSPLVAASSPLSKDIDGLRRLEDAGAAAVSLFSLFEEQLVHETEALHHYFQFGSESFAEALSYFPEPEQFHAGPQEYLKLIQSAKTALDIPIIGSLNGITTGGWIQYAKMMQDAGADGLELNVYYIATDPNIPGVDVEKRYLDVVQAVKSEVSIPLAVKIGPFFSSTAYMARKLAVAGANALVMFNRFYEPDYDIENLDVVPKLVPSTSHEMRLAMHWIALLFGRVPLDLAVTGGVHNHVDVIKSLMAGANCTQFAWELLQFGVGRLKEIETQLCEWMSSHEYESLDQLRGSMSQLRSPHPDRFERANYMKELISFRTDDQGLAAL